MGSTRERPETGAPGRGRRAAARLLGILALLVVAAGTCLTLGDWARGGAGAVFAIARAWPFVWLFSGIPTLIGLATIRHADAGGACLGWFWGGYAALWLAGLPLMAGAATVVMVVLIATYDIGTLAIVGHFLLLPHDDRSHRAPRGFPRR